MSDFNVAIIGGGLAGCECAFQLAQRGINVTLYEMRPHKNTAAHSTDLLAELVCSNSLRSTEEATGPGILKRELAHMGSLIMQAAAATALPAGKALAVDRHKFAALVTDTLQNQGNIKIVRNEIANLSDPALNSASAIVLASGPLTSESLSKNIASLLGEEHLYFYDAISPIVAEESVDMEHAFYASRYLPESRDYLNCPLTEEEYHAFCSALVAGEKTATKDFEKEIYYEGCMPIEVLAERGPMTLAFGPFKPVGLEDPKTGKRHFAVLQLRAEDLNRSTFNLVGCQTKLTYAAQNEIFRLIPAFKNAKFVRFGSMHRNTYINAPELLNSEFALKCASHIYPAGQVCGVEGYLESTASGLWTGIFLAHKLKGEHITLPPAETALGALLCHLKTSSKNFQPSSIHFGLFPELNVKRKKSDRKILYAKRAAECFNHWASEMANSHFKGAE